MVFWGVKTRVWWQVSTDRLSRDGSRVHIVHEFVSCRLSQVNSIIKASEALLQPNLQRLTKHTPCLLCHFNVVTRQSPPFLSYQPCLIELTRDTWMWKQICSIVKVIVASQMLWMVISEAFNGAVRLLVSDSSQKVCEHGIATRLRLIINEYQCFDEKRWAVLVVSRPWRFP